MNITERVSKQIGGEIEKTINENKEIQIYAVNDGYRWRDIRFKETRCEFRDVQQSKTDKQLFKQLTQHLKQ